MTINKMLIGTKAKFDFCMMLLSEEDFQEKFDLAPELHTYAIAQFARRNIENEDRMMVPEEMASLN